MLFSCRCYSKLCLDDHAIRKGCESGVCDYACNLFDELTSSFFSYK